MNQNQLEQARRTRWRQDGNALLTLDDAERWLADTPLCLYLPRRQHLPVPAPTFVEAIAGRPDPTPGPEQIAAAAQMLARLVASGAVIALNLFGAAPGIGVSSFVGEHPDFLATPEALPYLYALQPERNPKREPTTAGNGRVSPLAAEAWKLLEREGALTTMELRSKLGREVTEAAVLRSLAELWHTMRVVPVPAENPQEGAHWELLSARHRRELNIGSTQSQTTALSILVSFYLQSAVSATAEEVEIFLSPVASRSRLRDVVHGLSTTRQLASFSLAGDEQFYVEGTLPEIAEEEETVVLAASTADAASLDAGLEQNEPSLIEAAATGAASSAPDRARPAAPRRPSRPAFADRARGSFAARDRRAPSGDRAPRREGGFRRPQRSGDRAPGTGRPPFRRAEGAEGTGAEGTARPQRPNFERRARPSFGRSDRPDRPAGSGSAAGPRPDRPRTDRPGSDRPGSDRPGSDRPRSDRPDSGRPARSGGFARPSSAGKRFGSSPRPSSGRFERGGPSRGGFNKPGGFSKPGSFGKPRTFSNSRGGFDKDKPARPAGGSFRRDKPAGDYPPRTGEGAERPRFRPAGAGSPRFGQNRPGRPPARAGERPSRPFRAGTGTGEGRSSSRPDRPFRKPFGDRPAAGPRRFDSRPPRRDGPSRPQGDRPFKRPYSPAGARPPRPAPRPAAATGDPASSGPAPSSTGRAERTFTPRPRSEGVRSRPEGGERGARPFRAGGQRPGGFSKSGGRPGSFSKPSFGKPGYRKPAAGGTGTGKPQFDRPRSDRATSDRPRAPRPASGAGERPASASDAAPGARRPGTFRKPAGAGKSFGRPRPAGASSGRPRPAGAGKGRTSTTTSSGKPRRPGGFDKPRPGGAAKPRTGGFGKPGGRPPAKGGKPGGFKPGGFKAGAKRPGGIAAPKRKPRGEGDEG